MKLAIMQPYALPYLGYFQLVAAVDKFIFFDDVNYIKKGWINKNKILVNGNPYKFTIPVKDSSQNKRINEIELSEYEKWQEKFIKTIISSYKQSPQFSEVYKLLEEVLKRPYQTIDQLAMESVKKISAYMDLNTTFEKSSEINYDTTADSGEKKIVDICEIQKATTYINPINGKDLYNITTFRERNIQLHFIRMKELSYPQFQKKIFVPSLSIIDVLMFNDKETLTDLLQKFILE